MRISDWSSDVCSSDLSQGLAPRAMVGRGVFTNGASIAADLRLIAGLWIGHTLAPFGFMLPDRRIAQIVLGIALTNVLAHPCSPSSVHWTRSEEHTSELQSLMRISYAVFCLKTKKIQQN